jgi:hypothetical protein
MTIESGSDILSEELFVALVDGLNTSLPSLPDLTGEEYSLPSTVGNPLYGTVSKLEQSDLTTKTVDGSGMFDELMVALKEHLKQELTNGRITGDQYTKAYIAMTGQAMQTAMAFLQNREQLFWQSLLAKSQAQRAEAEAVTARIQLETAKVALIQSHAQGNIQNALAGAQYALAKLNLGIGDKEYLLKIIQHELAQKEIDLKDVQISTTNYQLANILPAQKTLLAEQGETQRANTLDTRSDGVTPVVGQVGKQKELYDQQIDSYRKDAKFKLVKSMIDSWVTRRTIDEGTPIPDNLANPVIDVALGGYITELELD